MMKKLLLVFIYMFVCSSYAYPKEGEQSSQYSVLGMGNTLCSEVIQNRGNDKFEFVLKIWMGGYLTALNSMLIDISITMTLNDLRKFKSYLYVNCEKNEAKFLAEISEEFWREIALLEIEKKKLKGAGPFVLSD